MLTLVYNIDWQPGWIRLRPGVKWNFGENQWQIVDFWIFLWLQWEKEDFSSNITDKKRRKSRFIEIIFSWQSLKINWWHLKRSHFVTISDFFNNKKWQNQHFWYYFLRNLISDFFGRYFFASDFFGVNWKLFSDKGWN